jgi:hypothetical protein
MRAILILFVILLTAGPSLAASAQDGIPDLTGTWTIVADGMAFAIPKAGDPETVHAESEFVIDHQDGFKISGSETTQNMSGTVPVSEKEQFAGVIGVDNKTVSMIDENGFRDCDIVSSDKMECIYRHVASSRGVVTRNTWVKQAK